MERSPIYVSIPCNRVLQRSTASQQTPSPLPTVQGRTCRIWITFHMGWKIGISPPSLAMGHPRGLLPFASLYAHAVIPLLAAVLGGTAAHGACIALLERLILEGNRGKSPGTLTCRLGMLNGASDCSCLQAQERGGSRARREDEEEAQMCAENKW